MRAVDEARLTAARERHLAARVLRARRAERRAERAGRAPSVVGPAGGWRTALRSPLAAVADRRPEEVAAALGGLLVRIAERIAEHGTGSQRPACEALQTATRWTAPGAAEALVDWEGAEVARLRAFGVLHGVAMGLLGAARPGLAARPAPLARWAGAGRPGGVSEPPASPAGSRALPRAAGRRASGVGRCLSRSADRTTTERARREPCGGGLRPPARAALHRDRRRPAATSSAAARAGRCWRFLLLGRAPPDPVAARVAALRARPTTRCGALRWSLAEVRRGLGPVAALDGDPVQLPLPPGATSTSTSWSTATGTTPSRLPGLRAGAARRLRHRPRRAVRGLAALAAAAAGRGHRVDRPRGRAGAPGPRRARPGARPRRPGDRHEPAGREPPGTPHPHLSAGRRRRGGRPPVRRLVGDGRARARHAARCRGAAGDARATAPPRRWWTRRRSTRSRRAGRPRSRRARWRPASRRSRPPCGWPTRRASTAPGSRPGWSSPRR